MKRSGYALFNPHRGWWCGRPGPEHSDQFSQSLVDACILSDEDSAVQAGVALCELLGGVLFWVYQVHFVRRRVGQRGGM